LYLKLNILKKKEELTMKKKKWLNSKIIFTITMVFVVCCFMSTSSWAARKVEFIWANAYSFIKQLNENNSRESSAIGSTLGLTQDEGLNLLRQRTDFNLVTHYRYQQSFKEIPVWGMHTIVSISPSNKVVGLHGTMVLDVPDDVKSIPPVSSLDPLGALKQMEEEHKKKDKNAAWNFRNEQYGTYIYIEPKGKAHLCYVVSFFADTEKGNPSQPIFFVEVKNGKVLHSFDMLRYADGTGPGGNQKIGQYYYGTDYGPFGVSQNGSTCTMNFGDVKTVDLNHGTSGSTPFSYTCYENLHKEINGAYSPLNDAQFFGQVVYDMYMAWYGVPVLPFQLTMRCHYSTNYENAFWNGSTMTFGDGYTTFYPLVALDVSAHEVSHGFTEFNSDLIYSGQSGGINEAFSDMAGEASEYYSRGSNDFKVGYDICKSPTGALRYMYDPPLDGNSIDHVNGYYSGLDVHYSSGVFNKAFWLVATTSGWDTHKAFDIFVKANQDYWGPSTNFQQGAEGALDAALDYDYNCQDVVNAFAVVGITLTCPPPVADFVGSSTIGEAPLTVNFTDQSTNNPTWWSWVFGDTGTSSDKDPGHTYTSPGIYTVTLTAANASGSDSVTETDYITVLQIPSKVADFVASATNISVYDSVMFTDQSTGNPTSWDWTFEGGTLATSTAQNPPVTYTTVGTFDVTLVATNAQGSDTETKVDYITVSDPYCESSGNSQDFEWIAGVHVYGSFNNTSGPSPYSDFTSMTACLVKNKDTRVLLTPGFSRIPFPENWKIWIDYNHDGDFSDTGEEVLDYSDDGVVNEVISVPGSTPTGYTRMRVSMRYDDYPPYCETFDFGEVEDYTVYIIDPEPVVGNNTVFTTTSESPYRRAQPFTMPENGTIDSVTMYHFGGSESMILGVYADEEGSPQDRLGVTATTDVDGSEGWQTIELTTSPYVAGGDTVWLAWVYQDNPGIVFYSTDPLSGPPGGRYDSGVGWSGGMPEEFGSGTQATHFYSIYATYTPYPPPPCVVNTVGYTTEFGSTTTSANRRAQPFTMPENGTIESVTMYHAAGSGKMILAVYDDEGSPQDRIAVTEETDVTADSAGWQTIPLVSPVDVTGGSTIWLAWVYESNPGIAYQSGTPGRAEPDENKTWPHRMPGSFGSSTITPYIYSIYANYVPTYVSN
jgi:Zn-dependent metalloprotease